MLDGVIQEKRYVGEDAYSYEHSFIIKPWIDKILRKKYLFSWQLSNEICYYDSMDLLNRILLYNHCIISMIKIGLNVLNSC